MKKQELHRSLTISFISILILSSIAGAFWYRAQSSKNEDLRNITTKLKLIAAMKADQVSLLLQGKRDRVVDFSSDGKIKDAIRAINERNDEAAATEALIRHLTVSKLPIDSEFYEVYAMDLSGTVVASTNKANIGNNLAHDLIYTIGKERPYVKNIAFDRAANVPYFNVAAPVIHPEAGLVGIIAIKMLAKNINTIMLRNYLGDTSIESYIINNERYLATPAKNIGGDNKGILAQIIDTENALHCIDAITNKGTPSHEEGLHSFVNYAGKQTLGTYHIVQELNWCVLVEVEI